MSDADMIIVEINSGNLEISDYFSTGYQAPKLDTSSGGNQDIELLGQEISGDMKIIKFKRKFITGDTKDKNITPKVTMDLLWSKGSTPKLT